MIGIGLGLTMATDFSRMWSPLDLTGVTVHAWHDASELSSVTKDEGNLVSQWGNLGPSAAHPVVTGANRPTYVPAAADLDDRPALLFANSHWLSYPAGFADTIAGGTKTLSIWAVCTWATPVTATYHAIFGLGQTSGANFQILRVMLSGSLKAERLSVEAASPGAIVANRKYLVRADFATGTNGLRIEKNQSGAATGTSAASLTLDRADIGRLCYNGSTNSPHNGYIEKLLVLSGVPDASNQTRLYDFFVRKCGPFTV